MQAISHIHLSQRISSTLKGYSDLFFVNDKIFGFIVLLTTFININIGIAGLWGIISIHVFDILIGHKVNLLEKRFLIYNALLVSLGVGYIFKICLPVFFMISLLSVSTLFLSIAVESVLLKYNLPALSIPFCLITIMIFFATKNYSNLPFILNQEYLIESTFLAQNKMISLLLRSIGAVLFIPNEIVGAIILLGQFFKSRMLFLVVIIGFTMGVSIEQYLTHTNWSEVSLVYAYNFVLISLGLGTVFMLPTIKSLVILPFALFLGIIINDSIISIFQVYQIPALTISFNITTLIYLYALRAIDYRNFPGVSGKNPEETLDEALIINKRNESSIKINLPFSGDMDVYQGFDDKWTHVGDWKHAVDFIVLDEFNKSYSNNKLLLEDYYCFGKPILAPISGVIVSKNMSLFDNQIGCVDTDNNWGNYLMIYSEQGYYVLICHLMQYSSLLEVGSQVTAGQSIALCGNSGYSPEPHLHIHVQQSGILGDKTIAFSFDEYLVGKSLHISKIPARGQKIRNINNRLLGHVLPYSLDRQLEYLFIDKNRQEQKKYIFKVEMDKLTGRFYLCDNQKNKLFIKRKYNSVLLEYFEGDSSSPLALLAAAIPEIPYFYEVGVKWNVFIPNKVSLSRFVFFSRSLLSFFLFNIRFDKAQLQFNQNYEQINFKTRYLGEEISGRVKINPSGDIDLIESNRYVLRKQK